MSYSFLLKQVRKRSRITLRRAALAAGISPATLVRYEEGLFRHIPADRFRLLMELCDAQRLQAMEHCFRYECEARYRAFAAAEPSPPTAQALMSHYLRLSESEKLRFRLFVRSLPDSGINPSPPQSSGSCG